MKTLKEIREAYDKNYREMLEIIQKMGGDGQIKFHRKNQTPLYRALRALQKKEHFLAEMEAKVQTLQEDFA